MLGRDLLGFGIGPLGMGFLDEVYWDAMIACMKLYPMGADRGEDVERYEDSFIDDDEVEGELCQNQQT